MLKCNKLTTCDKIILKSCDGTNSDINILNFTHTHTHTYAHTRFHVDVTNKYFNNYFSFCRYTRFYVDVTTMPPVTLQWL